MKKTVRRDLPSAQFNVIRILLLLAAVINYRLGCIHIRGAYLQLGLLRRRSNLLPPLEINLRR